jgi:hypothetical protein
MHSSGNNARAWRELRAVLSRSKLHLAIRHPAGSSSGLRQELPMMDIVMVALAVGFFVLSIAYVYACEQL